MVKHTILTTSLTIIQFALLSQISVGLPIAESEQHCQSKRSSLGPAVLTTCGVLGTLVAGYSMMNPPPVNPQDAPSSGSATAEHEQNATPHLSGADSGQGGPPNTHQRQGQDPDEITPAPRRPGEGQPLTPVTRQPKSTLPMEYTLPEIQRTSTIDLPRPGPTVPKPAKLAPPKSGVKRRDLTRLVRRQPGRSLERREWDGLQSRRLDSASYLDQLD